MINDYMHNTLFTDSEEAIEAIKADELDTIQKSEAMAFVIDEGLSSCKLAKY